MSEFEAALASVAIWSTLVLLKLALIMAGAAIGLHLHGARADRLRHLRWSRWEPELLNALCGDAEPGTLHERVRRADRLDFLEFLVSYALRLDGDSRETLREAAAPVLSTCIKELTHSRADRRALGIHVLGLLGSETDLPQIAPLLRDPSPGVAMTAARALARSGDEQFLPLLLHALDRFYNWDIASLSSMLALFGQNAGPALSDLLADSNRSEASRAACAEACRRIGYVRAANTAADVLASDPLPPLEVVTAGLRLIRDAGSPLHAAIVRPLCESDSEVVRMHAVSALATISLQPDDAARIEFALGDESAWVARRAARGLIESGRSQSLLALAEGVDDASALARQALAEAGIQK